MIKINLVPQDILDKELARQRSIQVGAMGAAILFVGLVISFLHYHKAFRLAKELKEDQAKFDKLQVIVAKVEDLERTAQAVRARLNVIQDLLAGRALYPRFMEDFLSILPSGIWLTNLTAANEDKALKFSLGARSLTSQDVAQWLRQLEKSDRFKEPLLTGAITIDAIDRINTFALSAKYVFVPPEVKR